ncbi:FUSC family protein [Virgibacillus necropolis]|uniref:FUSC family protein n=1 Tax=Virgibacillus necropolis TaxID=163877 RepID=UPI00384D7987
MGHLHIKHHWLGRLLASDPGRVRFQKAGKATISLMSAVFTTLLILRLSGNDLLTPAIVSGMVGMMGIMIVMDDSKKEKQITTLLLGVSAAVGITGGSLLAGNLYYIDVLMILVIFGAFYLTRFGVRYFSICMIGFITVYISSVLSLSSDQLPWFYMGILIGVIYAFLYNFILFKDSAQILKRSIRSFHIQSNLTFNMLIKGIQDTEPNPKRIKNLRKTVRKLRDYGRTVSGNLNAQDIKEIWPGLDTAQLRLYVFDTGMLIETLTESIYKLKKADALEIEELRRLLVWVIACLRDARVLAQNYDKQDLEEAELAVQGLRLAIKDLLIQKEQPEGWVFLIRRIESIANHVVEGVVSIQESLHEGKSAQSNQEDNEADDDEDDSTDNKKELKPSTKKAYQALVAGIIAIIVGQIISPTQPYWVLLTAFIVLLGTESVGRTYKKGFERSFGTIIGAALGFGLAKIFSGHSTIELILLFLVVFLAFYLVTVSYTMMSMFITMLIAFMYDILLGGVTLQLIGERVIDTIAGAIIAFAVSAVIFPKKTKDKVADSIDEFLTELKPYVTGYVQSFREDVYVKDLADNAFTLDQKLQSIEDEAGPLLNRPETISNSGIARWITIFTAINYYARHLVASSFRGNFEYPEELKETFKDVEEKLEHNIDTLSKLILGTERTGRIYSLKKEREQIERLAPNRDQAHRDLIHHLYYVWRINQSIVALGIDMGAEEK